MPLVWGLFPALLVFMWIVIQDSRHFLELQSHMLGMWGIVLYISFRNHAVVTAINTVGRQLLEHLWDYRHLLET